MEECNRECKLRNEVITLERSNELMEQELARLRETIADLETLNDNLERVNYELSHRNFFKRLFNIG